MNDSSNLSTIIVALIALVSLVISLFGGAVIYFAKWFSRNYGRDMVAHTKAATKQANASSKAAEASIVLTSAVVNNTQASDLQVKSNSEVLTFMKALNGKLAKATIQTAKEADNANRAANDTHKQAVQDLGK